jgi:hypothetical protein
MRRITIHYGLEQQHKYIIIHYGIYIGLGTFHRQNFYRRPISPNPISPTENFTDGKFHRRKISPTENFTDGKFHRQKISPTANITDNENFTEWKILQQKKIIKLKKKTEKTIFYTIHEGNLFRYKIT